jgi:hypothetical protein
METSDAAGRENNRTNAGLYDLIPPQNIRFNGVGEWNRARIVVRGTHVEHWLNGFRTVAYERGTQPWRDLVQTSMVWPAFGGARAVTSCCRTTAMVAFRSIKIGVHAIRSLSRNSSPDARQ